LFKRAVAPILVCAAVFVLACPDTADLHLAFVLDFHARRHA
jgi:hypothetical protein